MASESANNEIEIKLAVADHAAVRQAVLREGGEYLGSFEQTDQFYDTPQGRLRDAGCGMRIRRLRHIAGPGGQIDPRPQVTFKGPKVKDVKAKIRPEYQTHLDDAEAIAKIFEACGLAPFAVVRKTRESYRLGGCMVELDELAGIGFFAEIEGPSEQAVFELAALLGIEGEPIGESYLAMVMRHREISSTKPQNSNKLQKDK